MMAFALPLSICPTMRQCLLWTACITFVGFRTAVADHPGSNSDRPNVILIMVDDMGFSDLGCYGGEVHTPNLNQLAASGLRYTQFYNCAKCETTRATLLSGRYYPEVGNTKLERCWTIASTMRDAGYRTMMAGKWHLNQNPLRYGFDRYFGHLSGATNYFVGNDSFRLDDKPYDIPKTGFYTTDAITDHAVEFLQEAQREHASQPFFLYVAYNAPHYPLQAPKAEVDKYRGKYVIGWDELRRRRFARQQELGLFSADVQLTPRPANVAAWETLSPEERDHQDLMMATFAGMIDRVDQNIGRILNTIEQLGVRDNTMILFLSDNGACPFQRSSKKSIQGKLMPWDPESYWCYDRRWAHACNTPFREYKQNQHEGGIATPMIANWPARLPQDSKLAGTFIRQPSHLIDIMATCMDVANAKQPDTVNGQPLGELRGLRLTPHFEGKPRRDHEAIFFSFYGKNNALRAGDWKLVNIDFGEFELYNLANDRTELNNLADTEPEQRERMIKLWNQMSLEVGEPRKEKGSQRE